MKDVKINFYVLCIDKQNSRGFWRMLVSASWRWRDNRFEKCM